MPPPGHISKGRRAARLARERDFAMKLHAALLHVLQLRTPRLPPEVFDIIIGHALADMLGDLVVVPENLRVWEAGSVLLQVSSAFRTFTIKYLGPLWSGKFPVGNRRYKQTIMSCRRDSEYAHWWPHKFVCESKVPSVLEHGITKNVHLPIVIIFKHIFSGVAYSLSNLKDSWRDGALQPYVLDELTAFIKAYSHLPHRTKSVLFARIEQYLEEEYIPWIRASMLERAIHILSRSLLLEIDMDIVCTYPVGMLTACQTFNSVLLRFCEERLVSCRGHERDIVSARYNFRFPMWNLLMDMVVDLETSFPIAAPACRVWKQVFATIMSEGDRRRLLPNVLVATPQK